jgi:NADPH:quinone reductase-like Zn-dependent oxidoreductase
MHRQAMYELLEMVQARTLQPVIDRTFPLAQADAAHRYLAERKTMGKVVLVP